jgi:hypothetical protein
MKRCSHAVIAPALVSAYIILYCQIAAAGSGPGIASASSGEGAYVAEFAVDGDRATRWSSSFTDNEWWQFEFTEPRTVAGLRLFWETAYGRKYRVQLSDNGSDWTTVYEQLDGDGNSDLVFFQPAETRFVRLLGLERGTGWGYSIWDLEFLGPEQRPRVTASGAEPGHPPDLVLDGRLDTEWRVVSDETETVAFHFDPPLETGGLELTWGERFARVYRVELSADAEQWTVAHEQTDGNGGKDFIFFPAQAVRSARVVCPDAAAGMALADAEFKGPEEHFAPLRLYQAAAMESRPGAYPMWLRRDQEFWTITGVPGDDEESLLGETGVFEPAKGSFSVLPIVIAADHLVTWADVSREQRLEEDNLPLPSVRWNTDAWQLEAAAVSSGEAGQSGTAVRYRLTNRSDEPIAGRLALLVHPIQLNPAWQYGGFSPITSARWSAEDGVMFVNGRARFASERPPSQVSFRPLRQGGMAEALQANRLEPATSAEDPDGMLSAALLFDYALAAGAAESWVLYFPLYETASPQDARTGWPASFDAVVAEQAARWRPLLNRVVLSIPERRLLDVLKSNLAYILLNQDGPWIKPGPRNYNHSWIRDGALTSLALLQMGLTEPAGQFLDAYSGIIHEDGWVPWIVNEGAKPVANNLHTREGQEYDSFGQYAFLAREYFDYTADEAALARTYPLVVQAMSYARALRRERMTDEFLAGEKKAYYGLLPESNSHEGYYPAMHSYWDGFWLLRGLKDARHLAELRGSPEERAWLTEEEADARTNLYDSLRMVIARDGLDYIPGCVEKGDFDATSTAIALVACGERDRLPQPHARQTFDRYYENFQKRLRPGGEESFTPYEVRSANAFVRLGQRDRALAMLRHFVDDSTRPRGWNHMAEVVHGRYRTPSYIGDMPHTWVGSGYISAVRTLFAYEEESVLYLAAGLDPDWLRAGVSVADLPTRFGRISYTFRPAGDDVLFTADGAAAPPDGFRLPLPAGLVNYRVEGADRADSPAGPALSFPALPVHIRLRPPGSP